MSDSEQPKRKINKYVRFAGVGFQMAITIWLGNWFGSWLDGKYGEPDSKLYTNIFSLLAVFISIYTVIKGVIKLTKDD